MEKWKDVKIDLEDEALKHAFGKYETCKKPNKYKPVNFPRSLTVAKENKGYYQVYSKVQ